MKKFFYTPILIGFLLFPMFLFSQNITGKVTEITEHNKEIPVIGATLQWMNTNTGAITDTAGNFVLERSNSTNKLIVKYISYENDTIEVPSTQNELNIILSSSHNLASASVSARAGSFISVKPILTQTITTEGLRRAACCNLSESFEGTIAVDVEYSDAVSGAKHISMLGLAGIYTQIIFENVPYIRLLANQFGLGFVPGSWMEGISVSKGTSSVTNGYEGITGQIMLDYKKPETSPEKLFINGYGNIMGKAELNLNTRFDMNKKKTISSLLLLHAESQLAKVDMNKDGFLDIPLNYQVNAMYRLDYHKPHVSEGRLMVGYLFEDRIGGQMNFDPKQDIAETINNDIWGLRIKTNKVDVMAKNGVMIKGPGSQSVGTILSFTYQDNQAIFGQRGYNAQQLSFYLNTIYSGKFGEKENHGIKAGLSFQLDDLRERMADDLREMATTMAPLQHRFEAVPGVFTEYTFTIDEKFIIMPGIRLDYNLNYDQLFWTPRLHAKWQPVKGTSLRFSAGKGYRTSNVIIENLSLLVSNREFNYRDALKPEEAVNTGLSFVQEFNMPGGKSLFAIDYFYTHFLNQTIIDLDQNPHAVEIYNLNGGINGVGNQSFSHSFQAEFILNPIKRFEVTLAYRFNDVRLTTAGELQQKALVSPHKALLNLNYALPYDKWKFNATLQYNSPSRMPDMSANPEEYRPVANKNGMAPGYFVLNAQISKKYMGWEFYIGGENLLNSKQKNPIISADDPYGDYFDASVIYMPINGAMGYIGFRYTLK